MRPLDEEERRAKAMYSTKSMVPKKADAYISIGDPYMKKRRALRRRIQGAVFRKPLRQGPASA